MRDFAENMVRDHKAVNDQALALVKKLNVTPQDNDTSKALVKQATAKQAELKQLSGAAFDKAYADNEVAYHKTVDSALETVLIPDASKPELKDLLTTGLKIFQGHEQHAEHVAQSLEIGVSSMGPRLGALACLAVMACDSPAIAGETIRVTIDKLKFDPPQGLGPCRRHDRMGEQRFRRSYRDGAQQGLGCNHSGEGDRSRHCCSMQARSTISVAFIRT